VHCLQAQPVKVLDIQAHAGGKGLYPGNSIPAFIHAVKLGVTTLELDCVISADNKVVVSHDPFMHHAFMLTPSGEQISREAQSQHNLFRMPYDNIRQYVLGGKEDAEFPFQQGVKTYKPLLSEVIDSVESYIKKHGLKPVNYNIEVKSYHQALGMTPEPKVFVDLMMAVIRQFPVNDRVVIQSFDVRPLQYIKQSYRDYKTSFLLSKNNTYSLQQNLDSLGFIPDILSPEYPLVTKELMKEAHKRRMAVVPWTVDAEEDLRRMIALKVDGIITNYPDRLMNMVSAN
jgi:glycerophosphoryl diester phosphodiesterase